MGKPKPKRLETVPMADLIQDTGARQNSAETPGDPQKNGSGQADAPGGGAAKAQSTGDLTAGQESYMGPRNAGESDKPGGAGLGEAANDNATDQDPAQNNAQTPIGGDVDPGGTLSSDETGQAGVNDRPGKDKAHPWNG